MHLEYISTNLETIMLEIVGNDEIMNLLESNTPVLPHPFNTQTTETTSCEIRVYYPEIVFQGAEIIQNTKVLFDIVCNKSLWKLNGKIRPYEIARLLVNQFYDKELFEVGKITFQRMNHVTVNDAYDCIRLVTSMKMFAR